MIPKFRAWVKPNILSNHLGGVIAEAKPDFLGRNCLVRRNDLEGKKCFTEIFAFDDIELMQSTGLKDKNGVEIFEGDIVLADGVKKIVTFGEQEHEENFGDLIYYIGFNVYTKMGYSSVIPVEYEVIGNIWENSELLGDKQR
ncbi:hypothetical protein CUS80_05500 [Enterococcus faecium]|uniref:YopX family protein n=1 Tax=Enterococcus faecium TaxID=1352 RepID=UPI000CF3218F|nr:YopX family protein [Enterococcus faecium]PQG46357.1 hypothetical protein CUS80_05500 [Enterococcus faecium]